MFLSHRSIRVRYFALYYFRYFDQRKRIKTCRVGAFLWHNPDLYRCTRQSTIVEALLKLNGTWFGGYKIFDTRQIASSSFILAARPLQSENGYHILRIIILVAVVLSANQLLCNPELFPNYSRPLLSTIASVNNWATIRERIDSAALRTQQFTESIISFSIEHRR